jgi:hypothetical protein
MPRLIDHGCGPWPNFKVRLEKAKAGLYLGAERLAATYAGGGNSNTKTS